MRLGGGGEWGRVFIFALLGVAGSWLQRVSMCIVSGSPGQGIVGNALWLHATMLVFASSLLVLEPERLVSHLHLNPS